MTIMSMTLFVRGVMMLRNKQVVRLMWNVLMIYTNCRRIINLVKRISSIVVMMQVAYGQHCKRTTVLIPTCLTPSSVFRS